MLSKWLPWKFLVRHALRRYGFIDPFTVLARLRRFAQPSKVQEPIELVRAGMVFHARGLINTRAIQHNLDWVWPYWVERQFSPHDPSFIPRAFSFSHVNLSHRNWTAVGLPDWPAYPIVDPRGLITPLYDGWSVDTWVKGTEHTLLPSKLPEIEQRLRIDGDLAVLTRGERHGQIISSAVQVIDVDNTPVLQVELSAQGEPGDSLVVAVRPYNPEGIQFIDAIDYSAADHTITVEKEHDLRFSEAPDAVHLADYDEGDVLQHLGADEPSRGKVRCRVGMATAAAIFTLPESGRRSLSWRMQLPVEPVETTSHKFLSTSSRSWPEALASTASLTVPDEQLQYLYDAAVRSLLLLSADEIVPGPYTYRRFWFRDASLMMNALLAIGLGERCRHSLDRFPHRQDRHGYFRSQEGEWDSNGQVLWIYGRFAQCLNQALPEPWRKAIYKGAEWIRRKRHETKGDLAGLYPPGFSAEHFGPNDYYYWDDMWGVAGLDAAARIAEESGDTERAERFRAERRDFMQTITNSIDGAAASNPHNAWPAAPGRRMDAGAIGVLVADYPLQIIPPEHPPLMRSIDYMLKECSYRGAFFQDMIHSGINIYLTLTIAQVLLRAGDTRYRNLIDAVAGMASPTGQWPEAIHPRTDGGCMGDGQHGWAAAEWLIMVRNLFIREEDDALVLGSGLFPRWLREEGDLSFGPTHTPWGDVSVRFATSPDTLPVTLDATWHGTPPELRVEVPGFQPQRLEPPVTRVQLKRKTA